MFKKIDMYIMKKFFGTFFFMLIILMSLSVVFDLSERLQDFIKRGAPIDAIIFDYYGNFVFFYGNVFSAFIVFLSVIWFTSQMTARTEVVPILSSGITFHRFARPFILSSLIMFGFSVYFNHWVLPRSNSERLEFEELYYRNAFSTNQYHTQIRPNEFVYFSSYNGEKGYILNMTYEKWQADSLIFTLTANKAEGDSMSNRWVFNHYKLREFGGINDNVKYGHVLDTTLPFKLSDFIYRSSAKQTMTYPKLKEFIKEEKLRGSSQIPEYELEMYERTSLPFASVILTIIGLSVASVKRRGGMGLNIAIGIICAMFYEFTRKATAVAAIKAGVDPMISAWLPNIVFGVVAAVLYVRRMRGQ